jgi:uncharacterized repeat protein (TIGR02543 family)
MLTLLQRLCPNRANCFKFFVLATLLACHTVPAAILFEDDFNRSFPGWTAVQPDAEYFDGPLHWQYDIVSGAFAEQSNLYTDSALFSSTAIAPMLINDTVAAASFTYTARLTAGDDDGFGLIFGYQNENNFYRVTFARQVRTGGYPWHAWTVDRKVNGVTTNLFGYGKVGYVQTFVNRAGVPFDVTVSVNSLNQLTLSVLDNPTGASTNYPFVTSQSLPASAGGKVGIFSWGMAGGTPSGFRIQNLNLAPITLAGNPNGLTNWTAVVPPRAVGNSTTQAGTPFWSLSAGQDGPVGVLEEIGDCFQGNDAAGQVDFTGPTLVAGNDTWSNYVVAARITPRDDDAQGILLRYRNTSNFYRIALRAQVSSTGPPPGLSVQKNVNRVYAEVYRDNPVKYSPVSGQPYDLVAQIATNTLNILVVADPEGAAQVYNYGPFAISGVNTGKVGLLSWAMSRTEFDSISVQDGASLYVSSPYGAPTPPRGLSSFSSGAIVNAWAGPPDTSQTGVRRFPVGWTGAGSVATSGSATNVTFPINSFSRIHWIWQTEFQLTVTNGPGGTVSYPAGDWFAAGTNITIMARPDPGYSFGGWLGDLLSSSPTLNFTMDQPYNLVAIFTADSDGDGLPDNWELAYFGTLLATPGGDADGDGRSNLEEYQAGTNPTVPDILRIESLKLVNNQSVLTISNNTGTRYSVENTITLPGNWTTIGATQFANAFTSTVPAGDKAFWRLQQPARAAAALPFVPGSWTLVVLPDTQIYSESYPELFKDQTRWIVANRDRYNIKYVLQLGDIVNVPTALTQWTNARAAISLMDGFVPYALATGNHDHGTTGVASDRTTVVNNYFPVSNFTNWPTFGGTWQTNRIENSYHLFSADGVDWLIISLEWGPRNSPIVWANQIVTNYPDRKAILITHAYTYFDDTRYDWAAKGSAQQWSPHAYGTANDPDGTNDGEELWQKLVKIHPNFVMVFNGHVLNDGLGRLNSTNDFGNVVHQMLVNYQMKALGGEAFLRLVEFLPDGKTVQVKAYSPLYGTYKTDSQNQFILTLQPPLH